MPNIHFCPLGSVVILNDSERKFVVMARGLNVRRHGKVFFFDYGGVLYPDGLTGDQMTYFNHNGIRKIVFRGYEDKDDKIIQDALNRFLAEHPDVERADAQNW